MNKIILWLLRRSCRWRARRWTGESMMMRVVRLGDLGVVVLRWRWCNILIMMGRWIVCDICCRIFLCWRRRRWASTCTFSIILNIRVRWMWIVDVNWIFDWRDILLKVMGWVGCCLRVGICWVGVMMCRFVCGTLSGATARESSTRRWFIKGILVWLRMWCGMLSMSICLGLWVMISIWFCGIYVLCWWARWCSISRRTTSRWIVCFLIRIMKCCLWLGVWIRWWICLIFVILRNFCICLSIILRRFFKLVGRRRARLCSRRAASIDVWWFGIWVRLVMNRVLKMLRMVFWSFCLFMVVICLRLVILVGIKMMIGLSRASSRIIFYKFGNLTLIALMWAVMMIWSKIMLMII